MEVWKTLADVPAALQSAVTIGKFDALHLGHQALLAELVDSAENQDLAPLAITFTQHPDALLAPDNLRLPVIGPNQKLSLFEEAGVEATLEVEFNESFASLTPREFVQRYLVNALGAKIVLVGERFRFGSKASGDVTTLRELGAEFGFQVRVVPSVSLDGQVVSTTRVRELLDAGDVVAAARLLGRKHTTVGLIEHGLKIGRQIGFPTANMARDAEGYLPLDAVYAGWLYVDGERYPTALSVGINETFQAVPRLVEAHVIDHTGLDLYEKVVTLEYVEFIRRAAKFDGVESLVETIKKDLVQIKQILGV